jgi:hypothetical protein
LTTSAVSALFASSVAARCSSAGRRARTTDRVAARCTAVGKVSLLDCEAFTSSFGCTGRPSRRPARWAITSLAFMLDDVPDPVW